MICHLHVKAVINICQNKGSEDSHVLCKITIIMNGPFSGKLLFFSWTSTFLVVLMYKRVDM